MHSKYINDLENEIMPVIHQMQTRGLRVDVGKLKALVHDTQRKRDDLAKTLRETLGVNSDVNFNSTKDLSVILPSILGIKLKRTSTGRLSASKQVLRAFNNPITDQISQYKVLDKLLSSLKSIQEITNKKLHRIFCTYDDKCPSGRLYTKDYNVQGIPEIARSIILPEKGCILLVADYDSFELRILSALARDTYFKDCWARGLDLHKKVVSDMQGILYDKVTDNQRKIGKALNFGQSYGQEPRGLARNLHVSESRAKELMKAYKSKIPEIEKFKEESIVKARTKGYTETYYGRKRFLSEITSPSNGERRKAERRVINTMIQGSAADIIKKAIINLSKQGYCINTMVHDAVILSIPKTQISEAIKQVKKTMEIEINDMTFPVAIKTGKTWGDCK